MKFVADYRETNVVKNFKKDFEYETQNLPIGDFVIYDTEGNLVYIFERKTHSDLSSSIIDGRFREQKTRLLQSVNNDFSKIVYIIEEDPKLRKKGVSSGVINGAIIGLVFKHKFNLLYTNDPLHTAEILSTIVKKYKNDEFSKENTNLCNNSGGGNNSSSLVVKKESDAKNIHQNTLALVSGVSLKIAKEIISVFPCGVTDIIKKKLNGEDVEKILAEIQVSPKRKLGFVLAKRIVDSFEI